MARRAQNTVHLNVDEFLVYPTPAGKAELVRGELRVTPPGDALDGGSVLPGFHHPVDELFAEIDS